MKYRSLFSPFMAYFLSFSLVIPIYLLNWTYLFPKLSITLIIFFIFTFSIASIASLFFKDLLNLDYKKQTLLGNDKYFFLLLLFYIIEFAYSRKVPLLSLLQDIDYEQILENSFGIPTLHVFIVGYTAFIGIFFFHSYLSTKKRLYLLYYSFVLLLALLIVSRITITFVFVGSVYVYLMSIRQKFIFQIAKISVIALLFFAVFGLIGNLRSTNNISASDFILDVSEAKPSFRQSGIPDSYFWAYMYIASPLANFQLNIDRSEIAFTQQNFKQFVIHELFWDAVSKRIDTKYGYVPVSISQINAAFNVGTAFSRACAYLGLWGAYLMFTFIIFVIALFLFTLNRKSKYFITYLAAINTLVVLCIFDNIFTFTPLSIILVFPLLEKFKNFFFTNNKVTHE